MTVEVSSDPERLAQASGPRAQEPLPLGASPTAHLVETLDRLQRSQQNGAGRLGYRVQTVMDPVGDVHVGVSG